MPGVSNAVFLSYASEGAEAAEPIATALRAAGGEVWFDKSELRGGDAWDRQIRGQIRDCALFSCENQLLQMAGLRRKVGTRQRKPQNEPTSNCDK